MFKLAKEATYWWPVVARVPSADAPGSFDEISFDVQYRFLDNEAHAALLAETGEKKLTDRQVAPRLVTSFRDVQDETGADLAFSVEALDRVTNVPGVDTAIVREYFDSRAKAAEKN